MKITRNCNLCNKPHTREIAIDQITLDRIEHRRDHGQMIQDLIPEFTADEREFFLTGAHPACWDKLFSQED